VRNLGLKVTLWLMALLPLNSFALGLGEIEVNSFLNQPLSAEIEVISARPGEIDDLLVSLATREAFTRAGLERPRHLTDLKFTVDKSEDGETAVIMVTTRSAVKEPFLNFLIEADWSKGRLLREFTILLDPPFYADQPAPAETMSESNLADPAQVEPVAQTGASEPSPDNFGDAVGMSSDDATAGGTINEPIALSGGTANQQPQAIVETQASSPPSSSEYVADESENIIQGDVLVVKGDTLWGIAARYKDKDHSMAQVMLAFQRANPNAFSNGNINNMKVGAVLRAPGTDELDALDKQAAYAEALVQNGLWDEYVARVSGVSPATGGGASDSQASGAGSSESQGELSLLVPGEGDSSSTGTGDSADIEQLRTKLALAEEQLDASRIENTELESRISELQARLSKVEELQKMVEIEDDSLAQLQAGQSDSQLSAPVDDASDSTMADDDAVADTIRADEEALLEELLAEEAAAQAEEETALQPDAMTAGEGEEVMSDEMADESLVVAEADGDQMVDDEVAPAAVTTPPAPVIITEQTSSGGSMLDGILPAGVAEMIPSMGALFGNPIILAALGGVILLLLVLVLVKRRKAAQNDDDSPLGMTGDDDLFASDDEEELTPIQLAEVEDPVETDIKVPSAEDIALTEVPAPDEENEFAATAIISATDMPEVEEKATSTAEQDDVLNEVDVYLAYGLYDNAEDLLKSSLIEHPERADYRSKLLDTYFATKNVGSFVTEAENLKGMDDLANPYWDRVQIMGYELAPENALFSDAKDSGLSAADLEIAKPQEADFDLSASEEDDTNFSSTDFNLGEGDEPDFGADALLGEAGALESTQQISADTDKGPAPDDGGSDEADELLELPDDIGGELEFSMDDDVPAGDDDLSSGPTGEIELPEDDMLGDFDLDDLADTEEPATDAAAELGDGNDIALDFDMDDDDVGLDLDDAVQISPPEEDELDMDETEIITPNYDDTAVVQLEADEDNIEGDGIDLGMEDTAIKNIDDHIEETAELVLDVEGAEEDISIIDFGGVDFDAPTEMIPTVGDAAAEADDDDFVLDDDDQEDIQTGTFAPGDFDEPTAAIDSLANIDDLDDLMMPDDVDEVSTKLDLARAFIDMGDTEGARGSLEEVMSEGNADQKAEAKALLDQI